MASILHWLALVTAGITVLPAAAGVYLLVLAFAALFHSATPGGCSECPDLTVLVPAHDERDLIERCVGSLLEQDYPAERFRVVVIADNCTDETADLARQAGADVLIRSDPGARGKGRALRWAMDRLIAQGSGTEAFVIVDGDSVAGPGLLSGLAAAYERGAAVVQGDYGVLVEDSPRVRMRAVAFLLFHRVRFSGRAALGLPCSLVGNGMLLGRAVIESHPWDAFTGAEDLEYTIQLRLDGFRPVFAPTAQVAGPVPASSRAAQVQRERWEGGRLHVVRRALGPLVRSSFEKRRPANVDALLDLMVPPFGILMLGALSAATLLVAAWLVGVTSLLPVIPAGVAVLACGGYLVVGLIAGRAPGWMYASLLSAPLFLAEKALGIRRVVRHKAADTWIRTERPSEVAY